MKNKLINEIKRQKYKIPISIYRKFQSDNNGIDILEQDWDNLIVLDACRYDIYRKYSKIGGRLKPVTSKGSCTGEWFSENFDGKEFNDTVFVSGNPAIDRINASFCDIIRMWPHNWDYELGTALPDKMADRTIEVSQKYPNKRLISMFVQPHIPFIGKYRNEFSNTKITGNGIISEKEGMPFWVNMANGNIDIEKAKAAYIDNLKVAFKGVKRLVNSVEGKTVITADHGNSFGRLGIYGHPCNVYMPELVKVPWETIDSNNRKNITESDSCISTQIDTDTKDRLKDLGYV